MTEAEAEKLLAHAQDICRQLDEMADIYRQHADLPSEKGCLRLCAEIISAILNDIMIPLLGKYPDLDQTLLGGRFDAKKFRKYE